VTSISVVCPVYNESAWIDQLLNFITTATVSPKEVFLIDGGSTDNTVDRIRQWQQRFPYIKLLHNPQKFVPFALNLAIPKCTGDIIVRLDAHTEYEKDYFEKIIQVLMKSSADVVGGPTRTRWKGSFQHAVAYAICDSFGIGGSKVHNLKYEGETDSVTFGAWKRDIFKKTGLFDTALIRNQDDEFHYRVKSKGFRIFQSPEIKLYYYPRNTFKGLAKQYFQYGLYKPLVLKKVSSEIKLRHLVPAFFVLYLLSLPITAQHHALFALPLVIYLAILFYKVMVSDLPWSARMYLPVVFPAIHLAYGSGFILGLGKLIKK